MGLKLCGLLRGVVLSLIFSVGLSKSYAADQRTSSDIRCMLVGLRMMTLNTPQQRTDGVMLAIYYLGRVDGRAPRANVEQLLVNESEKITSAELRKDAARCGRTLEEKGHQLQGIGAAFSRGPKTGRVDK